mmetsp:Transcript_10686/g.14385  ORF Transcript_10686/g.14385 Transcript_10686/m.14385 type:complete len:225 (+) Transcript_10686:196-870(+)
MYGEFFQAFCSSRPHNQAMNYFFAAWPEIKRWQLLAHPHHIVEYVDLDGIPIHVELLAVGDAHRNRDQGTLGLAIGSHRCVCSLAQEQFCARLQINVVLFFHHLFSLVYVPDIERHEILNAREGVENLFFCVFRLQLEILELLVDLRLRHHGPWRRNYHARQPALQADSVAEFAIHGRCRRVLRRGSPSSRLCCLIGSLNCSLGSCCRRRLISSNGLSLRFCRA